MPAVETSDEDYYAAHKAMLERLAREGSPPPAKRSQSVSKPVTASTGPQSLPARSVTATETLATSRDVIDHSIAVESSSSSARRPAISAAPTREKRSYEGISEKTTRRSGDKSSPKRQGSPVEAERRKRPRKDEPSRKSTSDDVSMGAEDISMFSEHSFANSHPPVAKESKGGATRSSSHPDDHQPSKKASTSSSHAVSTQRAIKPLKLVPIDTPDPAPPATSSKTSVSDTKGKSNVEPPSKSSSFPVTAVHAHNAASSSKGHDRSARPVVNEGAKSSAATGTAKASSSKNPGRTSKSTSSSSVSNIKFSSTTTPGKKLQGGIMPKTKKAVRKWTADEWLDDIFRRKDEGKIQMPKPPFFIGMEVFHVPIGQPSLVEDDKNRYERLVTRGAIVQRQYDPATATHILSDLSAETTAARLGIDSVLDIPEHIHTVNTKYLGHLVQCYGSGSHVRLLPNGKKDYHGTQWLGREDYDDRRFAAFPERVKKPDTPPPEIKPTRRHVQRRLSSPPPPARSDTEDEDEDPRFKRKPTKSHHLPTPSQSSDIISRSSSPGLPPTSPTSHDDDDKPDTDPLAEFYGKAREEAALGLNDESEFVDYSSYSHKSGPRVVTHTPPSVWTVDNPKPTGPCLNQDIIDELERLHLIHSSRPFDEDAWRAFSYKKCIRNIKNYPTRMKDGNEARHIYGVGEKTAAKINEFLTTGKISRITHELSKGDVAAVELFTGIYGVGSITAYNWYRTGLRTLEDVRGGKGGVKLSPCQEIGLRFYDDINSRMPRAEAEEIFMMIKPIVLAIDEKLSVDIMGSFRRGKADCGDIDILITRPTHDGRTHAGVMARLWEDLHRAGILTEDLAIPSDMKDSLECCYRGLCSLPAPGSRRRRIDILMLPWQCRGAALLYYTGDDIFNRAMRFKAGKLGYSLNQRGLYAGVVRNPSKRTEKTNKGNIIASETEEEIFKILGVPWQEPWQRVRAV